MRTFLIAIVCLLILGSAGLCSRYGEAEHRAQELVKSGNRLAAAALLEQAIGDDSNDEAEWLRGSILIWKGAPDDQTLAHYLKYAEVFPATSNAPIALIRAGHLRDKLRQDPSVELQRVVKDYPHTCAAALALHSLGHVALRHKDPALAVKMFEAAADAPEGNPDLAADSRVEAGYACISRYWKTKDKTALDDAERILQPTKTTSGTTVPGVRNHLALGEIFLIRGSAKDAVREYQAALAAKPEHPYLLGIAKFGLASALYTDRNYKAAATAFSDFLDGRKGESLRDKDMAWKQTRPGFAENAMSDPSRGTGLTRADLVPTAAYWKAASLAEMKRYAEAMAIVEDLKPFTGSRIALRVGNLRKICAHGLGEDK